MKMFWRALALLVGLLFVYTGAIKIWDPIGFASDVENYHVVPWAIGARLAFYLPWLELMCGLALIVNRLRSGATVLLGALMLVFIGATISAKARGIDITCGCFGHTAKPMAFLTHLALDLVIFVALLPLTWQFLARRERSAAAVTNR